MSRLDKLMSLFESDPADAEIPYMIAQEHARAGEHEHAVAWYDRCLAVEPGHHYAYFHKARSLDALGRLDDARECLRDGASRARSAGEAKAFSELSGYLEQLDS